jgi:hypothetical protein
LLAHQPPIAEHLKGLTPMTETHETQTAIRQARRRGLGIGIAVGALVVGALTVGGVAVASIPSSGGTIDACVNSKGAVRIIDTAKRQKCVRGELRVTWGKTRYRGTWAATGTYAGGDIAIRNGSAYQAKTTSKGKDPATKPTYWGLLAARGAAGPQGPAGPEGPVGPLPTALAANWNVLVTSAANPGTSIARIDAVPAGTYTLTGRIQAQGLAAATQAVCQLKLDDQSTITSVDGNLATFTVPAGTTDQVNIPLVSVVPVPTPGSSIKLYCWRSGAEDLSVRVRLLAVPIGGLTGEIKYS